MIKKIKLQGCHQNNKNYVLGKYKIRIKGKVNKASVNEKLIYENKVFFEQEIIPKAYMCKPKILITRFDLELNNPQLNLNKKYFNSILNKIKALHEVKLVENKITNFEINDFIEKIQIDENIKEVLEMYKTENLVISHNDLGLNNILIGNDIKKTRLIDFEYASLNLNYFDYAHLWLSFDLNPKYLKYIVNFLQLNSNQELNKFYKIANFICVIFAAYCREHKTENEKYETLYFKYIQQSKMLEIYFLKK